MGRRRHRAAGRVRSAVAGQPICRDDPQSFFYERFGVEEYYVYDPDLNTLDGWIREGDGLRAIKDASRWVSPRLGARFELTPDTLRVFRPDGQPFETYVELAQRTEQLARQHEAERERAERLAAQLRALGIDPEA